MNVHEEGQNLAIRADTVQSTWKSHYVRPYADAYEVAHNNYRDTLRWQQNVYKYRVDLYVAAFATVTTSFLMLGLGSLIKSLAAGVAKDITKDIIKDTTKLTLAPILMQGLDQKLAKKDWANYRPVLFGVGEPFLNNLKAHKRLEAIVQDTMRALVDDGENQISPERAKGEGSPYNWSLPGVVKSDLFNCLEVNANCAKKIGLHMAENPNKYSQHLANEVITKLKQSQLFNPPNPVRKGQLAPWIELSFYMQMILTGDSVCEVATSASGQGEECEPNARLPSDYMYPNTDRLRGSDPRYWEPPSLTVEKSKGFFGRVDQAIVPANYGNVVWDAIDRTYSACGLGNTFPCPRKPWYDITATGWYDIRLKAEETLRRIVKETEPPNETKTALKLPHNKA